MVRGRQEMFVYVRAFMRETQRQEQDRNRNRDRDKTAFVKVFVWVRLLY